VLGDNGFTSGARGEQTVAFRVARPASHALAFRPELEELFDDGVNLNIGERNGVETLPRFKLLPVVGLENEGRAEEGEDVVQGVSDLVGLHTSDEWGAR